MNPALTLIIVSGEGMCAEECAHPLFADTRTEKISRMKTENGRKQLALAELAVLASMKKRFACARKNAYRYGQNGKPYPAQAEYGFLSIAHAGEYGACIWSDVPVGMDLETAERQIERVLPRISHEGDKQYKNAISLWCAKESYVKLTGEGVGKSFSAICVKEGRIEAGADGAYLFEGEERRCVWAVSLPEKRKIEVVFISAREALAWIG